MPIRFPFRRRTKPGAHPGSLVPDPAAPKPVLRVLAYSSSDFVEKTISSIEDVKPLRDEYPVVWVDVVGLGDARIIEEIGSFFGLHALALEDVIHVHQRPKVEEYEDHIFIVSRMATMNGRFETEQISFFLGRNFVLTFQERPGDCFEPVRERIRKSRGKIRGVGCDYLTYALLDAIVDAYFPVLETLDTKINAVELEVLNEPSKELFQQIHQLRGDLFLFKRTIWPHRDVFQTLSRDDSDLIGDLARLFLRDCYDHTIQITEMVETYREACAHLQDFYMNSLSQRMNEVMKVLTIIATIFMPLSFIAGLYGMNFDPHVSPWNMPELEWSYGYPFSLLLMAAVAVLFFAYFWRKGWL